MKMIPIAIYQYPDALKSAIYGLEEMFRMANLICEKQQIEARFEPVIIDSTNQDKHNWTVIILPPCGQSDYYQAPQPELIDWLQQQHARGAIIASACAGAFILAATGLLNNRAATTHWSFAEVFRQQYPDITLDTHKILIDHSDVITAGGMMSWLDLGFQIVSKYSSLVVMRQLGKALVIDTAPREQRFYQQFNPSFNHGDQIIVSIQQSMNTNHHKPLAIQDLAEHFNLTERTMQRRFLKATGLNPNQYLQKLRIQKACDLLEGSKYSFERIANQVGYENAQGESVNARFSLSA
ncbi:GlxA family transcriptional regulator [Vibrio breoganii]